MARRESPTSTSRNAKSKSRSRSPGHKKFSRRRSRSRSRSPVVSKSSDSHRSSSSTYKKSSSSHGYSSSSRSERDSDRNRRKEREKDKEKDRSRRRSRTPDDTNDKKRTKSALDNIVGGEASIETLDLEQQQRELEVIMQQRRERVLQWRLERGLKSGDTMDESTTSSATEIKSTENQNLIKENDNNGTESANLPSEGPSTSQNESDKKKHWSLDDEFDEDEDEDDGGQQDMDIDEDEEDAHELMLPKKGADDEEEDKIADKSMSEVSSKKSALPVPVKGKISFKSETIKKIEVPKVSKEPPKSVNVLAKKPEARPVAAESEDPDVDPLDAFMAGIQEEVKKLRGTTVKEQTVGKKAKLIVGVAVKKKVESVNKGELLEQDQDALEYSSEDEATTEQDLVNMNVSLNQSKLKKVQSVTIDDITYDPVQKDFYIEVPELAKMTPEEVAEYRTSLEGIKVKGKNCPKPIKTWAQSGVSSKILSLLKKYNYDKPTPIQAQAIPVIMSGRDMIGIAKTGSGKTLAFLIPMFRHIKAQEPVVSGQGPIGVIMTPTRELATQIWSECNKFAKPLGLRTVAVYGGTSISEQIGELKPGAEIVVCTPGRMIDMLAANNGKVTNLKRCTYIVLDEADRMFDMGFEPQVMRIIDALRPDRQTVMFSATFPRIMEALARRILEKPVEVIVGGRSIVCKDVDQNVCIIESEEDKFLKLLKVLGDHLTEERTAIVFVDKQESADSLLKDLMVAKYSCLALHGGIDQNDRNSIINDYKNRRVQVLVATSIAARGLDVKHCYLVVNYDVPNHYEDYVHRCGRTGRAGEKGIAWTFLTPDQGRYAGDIIKAFELSGIEPPEDVKGLFENWRILQEASGKKVKTGGGFSGKGFKFDEAEAQLANDKKKYQKAAFGLGDSDDEEEHDIDAEIESQLAPKKSVKQIQVNPSAPAPAAAATPTDSAPDKLDAARKLQQRLAHLAGSGGTSYEDSTAAFIKGEVISMPTALQAKAVAEQRAELLAAKLKIRKPNETDDFEVETGPRRSEPVASTSGQTEVFQRFEEELEINDFPQPARWRVTSREALKQISDYSDAGLTVRGTYLAPGTKVPEGQRKLYLAIEGPNELAVSKARNEIVRLIKEELLKLQSSNQPANKGRYRVV